MIFLVRIFFPLGNLVVFGGEKASFIEIASLEYFNGTTWIEGSLKIPRRYNAIVQLPCPSN
jgi:hypothetical protein